MYRPKNFNAKAVIERKSEPAVQAFHDLYKYWRDDLYMPSRGGVEDDTLKAGIVEEILSTYSDSTELQKIGDLVTQELLNKNLKLKAHLKKDVHKRALEGKDVKSIQRTPKDLLGLLAIHKEDKAEILQKALKACEEKKTSDLEKAQVLLEESCLDFHSCALDIIDRIPNKMLHALSPKLSNNIKEYRLAVHKRYPNSEPLDPQPVGKTFTMHPLHKLTIV